MNTGIEFREIRLMCAINAKVHNVDKMNMLNIKSSKWILFI